MSTPEGIKDTWKNIDWKNKDEKKAFYNKYFAGKEFVNAELDKRIESYKRELLAFMDDECMIEGKNKRKPNLSEIKDHISQ